MGVEREGRWSSSDLKHTREASWASSDYSSNLASPSLAATVACYCARAMDKASCGSHLRGLSHGSSSSLDSASTRFSSKATTEATTPTDPASLSDDDVEGPIGSILTPRERCVLEAPVQSKAIDTEANLRPHQADILERLLSAISTARELKPQQFPADQHIGQSLCSLLDVTTAFPQDISTVRSEHECKIDSARLDLMQAVEKAQSACATKAEIPILKAARDQLLADLSKANELGVPQEELARAERQRRRVHNAIQDLKGQVRVFCRIRPQTLKEKLEEDTEMLRVLDGDCVESPLAGNFFFNGVFAPGTQQIIFDDCKDLVQSAVDGHSVTIFSYGQTGAGKTFTMYGDPREEGLATRMGDELFNLIDELHDSCDVSVEGSIAEIYNNRLIDLLNPVGSLNQTPKLRQGKEGHVQIDDLSQWKISDRKQLKDLIEHGFTQRSVAETVMNAQSSRSHLILTVKLVRTDKTTGEARTGKIVFCDLAGSERLKKTEAVGERKEEAIQINKSLAALADVIEAVAAKRKHVPYRNHALTRILQDSLGGTAKTLMFVHCSPAPSSATETAMSLRFAARAGRIINM